MAGRSCIHKLWSKSSKIGPNTGLLSLLRNSQQTQTRNPQCQRMCAKFYTTSSAHDESNGHIKEEADSSFHDNEESEGLYPGHIKTTCLQKSILAVGSAALSLATPWRDDMIATMGEVTGYPAIKYMQQQMLNHPVGAEILRERPRINSNTVDFKYLSTLPDNTFGKHYWDFIQSDRINPDGRLPVQFVDDPELAYVMQRYREVHDLFHVLLGMPTHMLGEVVVKWVEGLQLKLPLGLLGGMFGAIRLRPKQRSLYLNEHLWYALRMGRNAEFLLNIYFEKHWEQDIHEMRAEFNVEEPPSSTPKKMWQKNQ